MNPERFSINDAGDIIPAIRPEIVAAKLAAIRNFEHPELLEQIERNPRLVELLWFIQAMSKEPGGLRRFALEFLKGQAQRVGTKEMLASKHRGNARLSWEECCLFWESIPPRERPYIDGDNDCWRAGFFMEDDRDPEVKFQDRVRFDATLRKFDYGAFREIAFTHALKSLGRYLEALCNQISEPFKDCWYFPNLISSLVEFMDARAKAVSARLAQTTIATTVFDTLEYARTKRKLVYIEGDPRFGKTESVATWCAMWPGRARMVKTPSSNSDGDFYREVAKALGLDVSFKSNARALKEQVEYVLLHGNLMLVFDEAQFLYPSRFSEFTPPARLNWVRTQIVDNHLPCALVATPQTRHSPAEKFLRKTSYRLEQWTGRIARSVLLPSELPKEDIVAVARLEFPGVESIYLELIAAKAMQSESYLKGVSDIASWAQYLAEKENRRRITLADIDQAISDVFPDHLRPCIAAPTAGPKHGPRQNRAKRGSAADAQEPCKRLAKPLSRAGTAEADEEFNGQPRSVRPQESVRESSEAAV